jgi:hypothetical protein
MQERDPDGITAGHEADEVELNVDQLALQLVAPKAVVLDAMERVPRVERRAAVQVLLIDRFDLPGQFAQRYAEVLVPWEPDPSSFPRHLRIVE